MGKYINNELLKGIKYCIKFTIEKLEDDKVYPFESSDLEKVNKSIDNDIKQCKATLKAIKESESCKEV